MQKELSGVVRTWALMGNSRQFSEITLPFAEANELFMPVRYNGTSGQGEQRAICPSHQRKLQLAMERGDFTPTPISVSLRKKHREALQYPPGETRTFSLVVDSDDPLSLTDGGHRIESLFQIVKEAKVAWAKASTDEERAKLQAIIDEANSLPITATIYLDGNPQTDFVNLQLGRTVDAAHLFSLKVQRKILSDPEFKLAIDTAKQLNKDEVSPFANLIRFDSKENKSLVKKLPISTLCAKGASDISTSLIGLAQVGLAGRNKVLDATALASLVTKLYQALKTDAATLLEEGMVLTPILAGGTKGSATMLLGVATCVAFAESSEAVADAVATAKQTLNVKVEGGFSGPMKRKLMGEFAREFFKNYGGEKHEGIPVELLRILSCSAFGVSPIPKPAKRSKLAATPVDSSTQAHVDTTEPISALADEVRQHQAEDNEDAAYTASEKLLDEVEHEDVETTFEEQTEPAVSGAGNAPWDDVELQA